MNAKELVAQMTLEEKAAYLSGKDFWHTEEIQRLGIPSFMMCDGPHGLRKQLDKGDHLGINESIKTICYPASSAVAASFDTALAEELGERLGEECQKENISMLLGPGINMKRSPLCGRNFEYYSEDPLVAGEMAAAYVKGLQSKRILACPKHFAANNQETKRMSGDSVVDERTYHEIYLSAFEKVINQAEPHAIMCAYNKINGTYCSENKELLTDILREQFGFHGFVVTDWGAGKDPVKGVKVGLDLCMPGGNDRHKNAILAAVEEGTLKEAEIDRAVTRILETFLWSMEGQPEQNNVSEETVEKENHMFARKMAENSAVLLKNKGNILPLRDETVAFIGAFASEPRYQGSGSSHINSVHDSDAVSAVHEKGKDITYVKGYEKKIGANDENLLAEAVETAKRVDKVIVFAGLTDEYESEGFDRKTLDMPENQNRLISEIAKVNQNIVVVLHNGAPVTMPWLDEVSGILEMYLGGDVVGEATVNLLYGDVNPSGKLPETFPCKLEDNPSYLNFPGENGCPEYREGIFIGYRYYEKKKMDVLFPFGYGLSYTTFEYSDLHISSDRMNDSDKLLVSVKVKNTGNMVGKEVVQLYIQDVESNVIRPVKELKAFAKVELAPGESKECHFVLDKRAFAYYEVKIHDYYVESGDFRILIGASSDDIRLEGRVHVESTVELPCLFTKESTMGDILSSEKGQQVLQPLLQQIWPEQESEGPEELGEGSKQMEEAMLMDMSLATLMDFTGLPEEQIENLMEALNS